MAIIHKATVNTVRTEPVSLPIVEVNLTCDRYPDLKWGCKVEGEDRITLFSESNGRRLSMFSASLDSVQSFVNALQKLINQEEMF